MLAPLICAGLTSYKGIEETKAKPGDWSAISGFGGLGHVLARRRINRRTHRSFTNVPLPFAWGLRMETDLARGRQTKKELT